MTTELTTAFRAVTRTPGASLAIVLTLALGIGANQTMFRVSERLLWSPPPHVVDSDRVVRVHSRTVSDRGDVRFASALSYPDYTDLHESGVFAELSLYTNGTPVIGSGASAEPVSSQWVGASLMPILGVSPELGRFFTAADDRAGAPAVAILSWSLWQRRYGGRSSAVGEVLRVGDRTHTIIGIAPHGFTGPTLDPVDLWLPFHPTAAVESGSGWHVARGWSWLQLVGRLPDGMNPSQASEAVSTISRTRREADGLTDSRTLLLSSLVAGDDPQAPTWASVSSWLANLSTMVWLIATANVANLLLAREVRRRRSTAIRLALGISRRRLMRQLLLEAAVFAAFASIFATLAASWTADAVAGWLLPGFVFQEELTLRVVGQTAVTTLVTAVVAGALPALLAARLAVSREIGQGSRSSGVRSRVQDGLVSVQTGFSVVLLVLAALFVRSLVVVQSAAHAGVDTAPVTLAQVVTEPDTPPRERIRIHAEIRDRWTQLEGVTAVASSTHTPLGGARGVQVLVDGVRELDHGAFPGVSGPEQIHVTSEFFRVLGLRLEAGRLIEPRDESAEAARVGVVSRSMARAFWPDEDPVGSCLSLDGESACTTVVGVVSDVRWAGLASPPSFMLYLPLAQRAEAPAELLVRRSGTAPPLSILRQVAQATDPSVRYVGTSALAGRVRAEAAPWRLGARLGGAFGGLALLIAGLGIHALLAFRVALRKREVAIRAALGAQGSRLQWMVLSHGLTWTGWGLGVGAAVSFALAGRLGDLVVRGSVPDLAIVALVVGGVLLLAVAAGALPARAAARQDPALVLRSED